VARELLVAVLQTDVVVLSLLVVDPVKQERLLAADLVFQLVSHAV
jgi:hypothetical protein